MRFLLGLPTDEMGLPEEFGTAEAIAEMARSAEALGYEGVYVTDHPAPRQRYIEGGGHHALEPSVALAVAAAVTSRLRLMTNLYVVAYRNPFIAAKAIASLDALSGGRVILGTGAGYLEPEFRALGADFDNRNEVLDRSLDVMKRVWTGEPIDASGPGYEAKQTVALPTPAAKPHPPIWIGGNSKRALRRAVELADGWIPMAAPRAFAKHVRSAPLENLDDLRRLLAYAHQHAREVGRAAPLDVMFGPFLKNYPDVDPAAYAAATEELAELGVGYAGVAFGYPGRSEIPSRARFIELAEGFARDVMERCRER